MKVLLAIALVLTTLTGVDAQSKGVDFDDAIPLREANYEDNYERLCKLPDVPDGYLYFFRSTTIGVQQDKQL